jgi:hypothetical protein
MAVIVEAGFLPRRQHRRGLCDPRALAAFVKRPQASLLKSALCLFYKRGINGGQRLLCAILFENIEYYTSREVCRLEPFSSGPFMIAGVDRNCGLDAGPGYAEVK